MLKRWWDNFLVILKVIAGIAVFMALPVMAFFIGLAGASWLIYTVVKVVQQDKED